MTLKEERLVAHFDKYTIIKLSYSDIFAQLFISFVVAKLLKQCKFNNLNSLRKSFFNIEEESFWTQFLMIMTLYNELALIFFLTMRSICS